MVVPTLQQGTSMSEQVSGAAPAGEAHLRAGGVILVVATVLEILAMAHHPHVSTPDVAAAIRQIVVLSPLAATVHGVLMALMLSIAFAFSEFALRRGASRPLIRAGAIAYGAGVVIMLIAALVSGFVLPDVAAWGAHESTVDLQMQAQLFTLCRALNQASANFGAVAMAAGIGFWSADLLRSQGAVKGVGVFGCLISVGLAAALLSGAIRLDVHGMSAVVLLQGVWSVAVGILMVRRKV